MEFSSKIQAYLSLQQNATQTTYKIIVSQYNST